MEMDDPIIQEIREAREKIQRDCGGDVHRMTQYFMDLQKQYAHRLVQWEHPDEVLEFDAVARQSKP